MLIGNKMFSYPILNHDQNRSTYFDKSFDFEYGEEENESQLILKDIHFSSNSTLFNKLFNEGKIKVRCVIECSQSIFRNSYDLTQETGHDIVLNKAELTEKVVVSAFAYATEDITIESDEFIEDYHGIKFDIEKYNILAAHDGYNFYARKEEKEDNIVHSIFTVIPSHEMKDDDGYEVNYKGKKISISLSDKAFSNYKIIYTTPAYKEIFFGMILVHALEMALSAAIKMVTDDGKDLDDICNTYRWFSSVMNGFLLREGKELTIDILKDYSNEKACLLAQKLLGNPINKALGSMVKDTQPKGEYGNE